MVIQPSEILKIGMPLMLAWWFQKREGQLQCRLHRRRPAADGAGGPGDETARPGTALLILAGGLYVIFFAGLSWKLVLPVLALARWHPGAGAGRTGDLPAGVDWHVLRDYQKHRVCTCSTDEGPAGQGLPHHPGMIAIGSGGITGKGFMNGTQTHLEFIPSAPPTSSSRPSAKSSASPAWCCCSPLSLSHLPRPVHRGRGADVFTRLLPGHEPELLHLRLRQHGHGQRILPVVACRCPSSATRHRDGDAGPGLGILMSVSRSRRLMQS